MYIPAIIFLCQLKFSTCDVSHKYFQHFLLAGVRIIIFLENRAIHTKDSRFNMMSVISGMSAASLISIVYLDLEDVLQCLKYSKQILRGLSELTEVRQNNI
jgi:hypothetical protein